MAERNRMKEMPVNKLMVQMTDDLVDGIAGSLQYCGQCLCRKHEGGK